MYYPVSNAMLVELIGSEQHSNNTCCPNCYVATDLGLCGGELNEADALELARLTVSGQADSVDSTAVSKGCCELLAHCILAQVLVKALHKDGGAIAV